jgi:hypothetical protein
MQSLTISKPKTPLTNLTFHGISESPFRQGFYSKAYRQ